MQAVLDYRLAHAVKRHFNSGEKGFESIAARPDLQRMLLRLCRAQQGDDVQMADAMARAQAMSEPDS